MSSILCIACNLYSLVVPLTPCPFGCTYLIRKFNRIIVVGLDGMVADVYPDENFVEPTLMPGRKDIVVYWHGQPGFDEIDRSHFDAVVPMVGQRQEPFHINPRLLDLVSDDDVDDTTPSKAPAGTPKNVDTNGSMPEKSQSQSNVDFVTASYRNEFHPKSAAIGRTTNAPSMGAVGSRRGGVDVKGPFPRMPKPLLPPGTLYTVDLFPDGWLVEATIANGDCYYDSVERQTSPRVVTEAFDSTPLRKKISNHMSEHRDEFFQMILKDFIVDCRLVSKDYQGDITDDMKVAFLKHHEQPGVWAEEIHLSATSAALE